MTCSRTDDNICNSKLILVQLRASNGQVLKNCSMMNSRNKIPDVLLLFYAIYIT